MLKYCQLNGLAAFHRFASALGIVWIVLTSPSAAAEPSNKLPDAQTVFVPAENSDKAITLAIFLDRLMIAESGGRDAAANPRSSARGAFQFIDATFLYVMRKHFPGKVAKLTPYQILALRRNRDISRKAAAAYTRGNAAYLNARGVRPTFTNLRLAFLLGPTAALRVLTASPVTPLTKILPSGVIKANPFMARLSVSALILRAARDISITPQNLAKLEIGVGKGAKNRRRFVHVHCNLSRASCRRWLALRKRKARRRSKR